MPDAHVGHGDSGLLADFKRWSKLVADLPEPVTYVVIDHAHDARVAPIEGRDASGRKYVLCSPAVLDEARHVKWNDINVVGSSILPPALTGIPLYRREDMPEGWPDA